MIIYTICLAVGLLFTVISAIAGHLFGGHDGGDFGGGHEGGDIGTGGHAESGIDSSGVPGLSFFSPTVLASFVTAFGACGLILTRIEATSSVWVSAPISALIGVLIAFGTFLIFNKLFSATQSSSEAQVSTLVGQTASIITPIPSEGVGEIAYVRGGSRYTAPARSEAGTALGAGKTVRITRIVGSQFYVDTDVFNINA